MKKYLAILAYYIAIVTVSFLVGSALALYVLARLPWLATATLLILTMCVVSLIDYRRVTTNRTQHKNN